MKSKITPKKINVFFFKKTSLFVRLKSNISLLFIFLLINTFAFSQSNSCKATLTVENNGHVDSASQDGVVYKLILTNNGTSAATFTLAVLNNNANCKNPDESQTSTNVVLSAIFLDLQKNAIKEITVNPGESLSFLTKLTVPSGTSLSKWSCNQVIATATNCTSYTINTSLYTYVLNPNND